MKTAICLVLVGLIVGTEAMRQQSIAVKAKFMCGDKPLANARVKLWEEDSGPDPDDLVQAGYTDANGEMFLSGDERELTNCDFWLKIYHTCDDSFKMGARKVKFELPYSYVTAGKIPKKTYDLGTLNMETKFHTEERELIVSKRSVDRESDSAEGYQSRDRRYQSRRERDVEVLDSAEEKAVMKEKRKVDSSEEFTF
uniref:Transthyretin-like family protein n=1 Tax=Rhabditophanes sp. KR3021 TaxID=114890 RepID=A0AC35UEA8_9BILA